MKLPAGTICVSDADKCFKKDGFGPHLLPTMDTKVYLNVIDTGNSNARRRLQQLMCGDDGSFAFFTIVNNATGNKKFVVLEVKVGEDLPKHSHGLVIKHLLANGLGFITRRKVAVNAGNSNSLILANTEANAKFHLCGVKYHCDQPPNVCSLKAPERKYFYTQQRCSKCGHPLKETVDKLS